MVMIKYALTIFFVLAVFLFVLVMRRPAVVDWRRVPSRGSSSYVENIITKNIHHKDKAKLLTYNIEDFSKASEEIKKTPIKDVSDFITVQNMVDYIHSNGVMQYNNYHNQGITVVKDTRGDIFGAENAIKQKTDKLDLNPWQSDSQNVHDKTYKISVKNKIRQLKRDNEEDVNVPILLE
jgi:hypothetical protein